MTNNILLQLVAYYTFCVGLAIGVFIVASGGFLGAATYSYGGDYDISNQSNVSALMPYVPSIDMSSVSAENLQNASLWDKLTAWAGMLWQLVVVVLDVLINMPWIIASFAGAIGINIPMVFWVGITAAIYASVGLYVASFIRGMLPTW